MADQAISETDKIVEDLITRLTNSPDLLDLERNRNVQQKP